jgi:hypothetical protein
MKNRYAQPSFNFPDSKAPRFCGDHQLEGMVNVRQQLCEFEGCLIQGREK